MEQILLIEFTKFLQIKNPELLAKAPYLMVSKIPEGYGICSFAEGSDSFTAEDWEKMLACWQGFVQNH